MSNCDILIEVYEQCIKVSRCEEQWETHKRSGEKVFEATECKKITEALSSAYRQAFKALCDLIRCALLEEVTEAQINAITGKYLPDFEVANGELQL